MASQLHWIPSTLKDLIPAPDIGLSSLSAVPVPVVLSEGLTEYLINSHSILIRLSQVKALLLLRNVYITMGFADSTVSCLFPGSCSVIKSCPTLCNPMDYSTPSFPVLHHLRKLAQTHVHWISGHDSMSSHHLILCPLLLPPSVFPCISVFFQWVSCLDQVAKVFLEVAGLILFELNCLPPTINSYVEVVTPSNSECDFNWKQGHFRYHQLVDEVIRVALDPVWLCPY